MNHQVPLGIVVKTMIVIELVTLQQYRHYCFQVRLALFCPTHWLQISADETYYVYVIHICVGISKNDASLRLRDASVRIHLTHTHTLHLGTHACLCGNLTCVSNHILQYYNLSAFVIPPRVYSDFNYTYLVTSVFDPLYILKQEFG